VYPVKVGLLGPKELFARKLFAQSYYHFQKNYLQDILDKKIIFIGH